MRNRKFCPVMESCEPRLALSADGGADPSTIEIQDQDITLDPARNPNNPPPGVVAPGDDWTGGPSATGDWSNWVPDAKNVANMKAMLDQMNAAELAKLGLTPELLAELEADAQFPNGEDAFAPGPLLNPPTAIPAADPFN